MKTVILFLGLPGSGKGTQARKLCSQYNILSYSLGELLRSYSDADFDDSIDVKNMLQNGLIVPGNITNHIVKKLLDGTDKVCLLDGYPRNMEQADFLNNCNNLRIIPFHFDLNKEFLLDRILNRVQCKKCSAVYSIQYLDIENFICISCGLKDFYKREDDNITTLNNRITQFENNTKPVLNLYNNLGILNKIDASNSEEQVNLELNLIIKKLSIDF